MRLIVSMVWVDENRPRNIKVRWDDDIRVGYDKNWCQDVIFTRKISTSSPKITRKGPKCPFLSIGFACVSSTRHMWWTRLGPEEENFGSHHGPVGNDKVWSDSMINDVFVNVETWYESPFFDQILFYKSWERYYEPGMVVGRGSPQEKSLTWVMLWSGGDNKGLTTRAPWGVQSVFKEVHFWYFLKKQKVLPPPRVVSGLRRPDTTRGGGRTFCKQLFLTCLKTHHHVLYHLPSLVIR